MNHRASRRFLTAAGSVALTVLSVGADAADSLMGVYALSLDNDPAIRAAYSAYQADIEARPRTLGQLLPSIGITASTDTNRQDSETESGGVGSSGVERFNSQRYALTLSQPLFNVDRMVEWRQAGDRVRQAETEYAAAQQDLILRVAEAYFRVLGAGDDLDLVRAEIKAVGRQLEQATERFEVGLIPITDVHEAQASYDLRIAEEIAAEQRLEDAREGLRTITGRYHEYLQTLGDRVPLLPPDPADIDAWTMAAVDQNLALQSRRSETEIARREVGRQRSGHYPTVDVVASQEYLETGGRFGTSETTNQSIGLEFALPLFEGGQVNSRVREAMHRFDQARDLQEEEKRSVIRRTRDAYRGVLSGVSQVKALKQAVISAEVAVQATEAGMEVGTRTIVDVLVEQRRQFQANRDFLAARYNYVLDILRLKEAAGTLVARDLREVASWLD